MTLPKDARLTLRAWLVTLAALVSLVSGCSDPDLPLAPPGTPPGPQPPLTPQVPLPPTPQAPVPVAPDRIYLADATGENVVRLTVGTTPAWSRDGRRIAFERDGTIMVIDTNGTNEVSLRAGTWPSWSPDGLRIAFTSAAGISVMKTDGSDVKTLIRHEFLFGANYPWDDMGVGKSAWSPDAALIAFEHLGDGDIQPAQVFVMNSDGSNPRRLSANGCSCRFAESDPAWSPDGTRLAYWSYGFGIAVTDVRDGFPKSVYQNFPLVAYGAKPAWTPDGKEIAFNTFRYASGIVRVFIVPVSRADGSGRVFLEDAYYLTWSPDGKRIAFVSNRAP